jgi:hypothetical protein
MLTAGFIGHSNAALTIYQDKADYLGAVDGTAGIVTFDGGPASPAPAAGEFSPLVSFGLCGKPGPDALPGACPAVIWQNSSLVYQTVATASSGIYGWLPITEIPIPGGTGLVFPRSFAFDISGDTSQVLLSVENSITGYYDTISLDGKSGFIGIVPDQGFYTFALWKTIGNPGYEDPFYLDNFYLPPVAAVPEPQALSLLIAGCLGLRLLRRKRLPPQLISTGRRVLGSCSGTPVF